MNLSITVALLEFTMMKIFICLKSFYYLFSSTENTLNIKLKVIEMLILEPVSVRGEPAGVREYLDKKVN